MIFGNYAFQGPWPWTFTVTTMVTCPYLYVVCNYVAPPHRFIAVGQMEGGCPLILHNRAKLWENMSIGALFYYHFPTRPEVYSTAERESIVVDLGYFFMPLCPN